MGLPAALPDEPMGLPAALPDEAMGLPAGESVVPCPRHVQWEVGPEGSGSGRRKWAPGTRGTHKCVIETLGFRSGVVCLIHFFLLSF